MSNNSIDEKLKGLQERLQNEMRTRGDGGLQNQGGLGTPKSGGRKFRPCKYICLVQRFFKTFFV